MEGSIPSRAEGFCPGHELVGAEPRVSGTRFRAGECSEEGSIRVYGVLYVEVHVRDVVDSLPPREPGR